MKIAYRQLSMYKTYTYSTLRTNHETDYRLDQYKGEPVTIRSKNINTNNGVQQYTIE